MSAHGFGEELRGVASGTKQEHCVVHHRIAVLGAHGLLENVVEARAPADGERCAVEPDVKFERQTRFTINLRPFGGVAHAEGVVGVHERESPRHRVLDGTSKDELITAVVFGARRDEDAAVASIDEAEIRNRNGL